jgi:hypothetical protein
MRLRTAALVRSLPLLPLLALAPACTAGGPTPPEAPALFAEPEPELEAAGPVRPDAAAASAADAVPALLSASGSDGHAPALAADGDARTRWSQYGHGAWLQADLGRTGPLQGVDVTWHRGDRRYSRFSLSVSEDGARFTRVYTGLSSGRTQGPEHYSLRGTSGRYVRLTVDGNSENAWASVSELAVHTGPAMHAASAPRSR